MCVSQNEWYGLPGRGPGTLKLVWTHRWFIFLAIWWFGFSRLSRMLSVSKFICVSVSVKARFKYSSVMEFSFFSSLQSNLCMLSFTPVMLFSHASCSISKLWLWEFINLNQYNLCYIWDLCKNKTRNASIWLQKTISSRASENKSK